VRRLSKWRVLRGTPANPAIRDEALSCLQLVTAGSDEPQATLLVYPCHPEVLWDGNPHITSDYLAAMRRVVEHATRAHPVWGWSVRWVA
jgi:hypothetical protein